MRIWYVVDTHEYWLEPDYRVFKNGRLTIDGTRLYDTDGRYKGYWHVSHWPLAVKRQIAAELRQYLKRQSNAARLERVRMRSHMSKTK